MGPCPAAAGPTADGPTADGPAADGRAAQVFVAFNASHAVATPQTEKRHARWCDVGSPACCPPAAGSRPSTIFCPTGVQRMLKINALPHVKASRDVPTLTELTELGYPASDIPICCPICCLVLAPAGTPKDIVPRLA